MLALGAISAPPERMKTPLEPTKPAAFDGSLVSARIVDGFSPYLNVTYEVLWRQNVAVANHYRGLVNYSEPFHDMALVTKEEFAGLISEIDRLNGFSLPDVAVPESALAPVIWEVELKHAGRTKLFRVGAPEIQSDPRYAEIIQYIQRFVVRYAGDLTFRNVFFEPGTYGWVNLTSVPPATVTIDGRDTGLSTPIYGYELPAGKHQLRLYAAEQNWERLHTVRIDPGMTTIVHFDLR